jgi:hypothetical protein
MAGRGTAMMTVRAKTLAPASVFGTTLAAMHVCPPLRIKEQGA